MNYIARAEQAMQTWNHIVRSEQAIKNCLDACRLCHQICFQTAMKYSLNNGEKEFDSEHFIRMMNCAEICQLSVSFQLSNSDFNHRLCELCAEVCEACATNCEKIGGMIECVEACRNCASSCKQISKKD
jgi:hypothetical protein